MNDMSEPWAFLWDAWRYALVLAGSEPAASRLLDEALQDLRQNDDAGDPDHARRLLFSVLYSDGVRIPRHENCDPSVALFHHLEEPGRSALVLLYLDTFSADEIGRLTEMDEATTASVLESARAELGRMRAAKPAPVS